jgi:hypothetical protein
MNSLEKIRFVQASGADVATLEKQYGVTQKEMVDELIENTCWRDAAVLSPFAGKRGSDAERHAALLAAIAAD